MVGGHTLYDFSPLKLIKACFMAKHKVYPEEDPMCNYLQPFALEGDCQGVNIWREMHVQPNLS